MNQTRTRVPSCEVVGTHGSCTLAVNKTVMVVVSVLGTGHSYMTLMVAADMESWWVLKHRERKVGLIHSLRQ